MGPQLDASHEADEAEIREVSQVISALSQNGFTHPLAHEVYQNIQTVIQTAMNRYLRYLDENKISELSEILTNKFIQGIQKSDRDEVTKALLNTLKDKGVAIPFSNQNFYNLFIREIVTTLNNEFITRHYSGLGGVLVPSHGIFQVYDSVIKNENGEIIGSKIITQNDIIKESLFNYQSNPEIIESNEQIINNYINSNFRDIIIHASEIELGDTIIAYGIEHNLNNPTEYYKVKSKLVAENTNVYKVLNKSRDLKPTLHSFTVNNQIKNGVKELFNENSELASIGTEQQYSEYLDTIFPDSKVKDIVYHGSDTQFEDFLEDNLNYFGTQEIAKGYGKNIYPVLIEIKKPYYEDGGNLSNQSYEDLYDKLDNSGADGFISNGSNLFVPKEPEQIHILGSKQDIKGFKEFVLNNPIIQTKVRKNVFDLTPVRLLYKYLNNELDGDDLIIFNNFNNQYVQGGNIEAYLRA